MSVNFKLFHTGYCVHSEKTAIKGGKSIPVRFYATFALVTHPQLGHILFDTGYSNRFYEATSKFPFNIYAKITPVFHNEEQSAVNQLKNLGINSSDVNYIIISHFHADHIGGLKDFPNAKFICLESAYKDIKGKQGFRALQKGFLPDLLPSDFSQRISILNEYSYIKLGQELAPFENGFDISNDETVIAVQLEGHACGQIGLIVKAGDGNAYFLISDACWLSKSYQEFTPPHRLANIIFSDSKKYLDTLKKLHSLHLNNPRIKILPAHCSETLKLIKEDCVYAG